MTERPPSPGPHPPPLSSAPFPQCGEGEPRPVGTARKMRGWELEDTECSPEAAEPRTVRGFSSPPPLFFSSCLRFYYNYYFLFFPPLLFASASETPTISFESIFLQRGSILPLEPAKLGGGWGRKGTFIKTKRDPDMAAQETSLSPRVGGSGNN